jgi:hypothetical protein
MSKRTPFSDEDVAAQQQIGEAVALAITTYDDALYDEALLEGYAPEPGDGLPWGWGLNRGVELIALYEGRGEMSAAEFDAIAREHGRKAIRRRFVDGGIGVPDEEIDVWIDEALMLLTLGVSRGPATQAGG